MAQFKKGQRVRVSPENDNENYEDFNFQSKKILIITDVATSGRGYDEGINAPNTPTAKKEGLYSFKTENGEDVPFSLYDYELISAL